MVIEMADDARGLNTRLVHAGLSPDQNGGVGSTPVYHASTVYFPSVQEFEARQKDKYNGTFYGRYGTPTTFAFEDAVAELEGGFRSIAVCSGSAAAAGAILGFVGAGDHILLPDTVWGPVRGFCDGFLSRMGIQATYYDPMRPDLLEPLIRDTTRVLYLESPGSVTYEVQDVPAFVAVAKSRGLVTMIDNTWSSPIFFQPLKLGVDVSIIAATKFIVGHSDAMMGLIVCNEASFAPVRNAITDLGYHASPDDCYLAHRGLRTAALRMRQHEKQGVALAQWLSKRPEVARVLHPAMPDHVGHEIWKRDFSGSSGVFGVELKPVPQHTLDAMLREFKVFGIGASWGGLQSIIIATHPDRIRTVSPWKGGPTLRIHTGLEDIEDLQADLDAAFKRMRAAL
jgi:cystathionine beta-lyase